jgi:hypothetical protein
VAAVAIPAAALAALGFFSPRIHSMPDYAPLASFVRGHAQEHDRIAIWGHLPEVYWASERLPAVRFPHTDFLTGHAGHRSPGSEDAAHATTGAWELFFSDLERHPPALFLDTSPAAIREYEHYPIAAFPRLRDHLGARYHPVATVGGVIVYEPNQRPTL